MLRWLVGICAGVLMAGQVYAQAAVLSETVFPARGSGEALLKIEEPGRYSIRAASGQGAAIELVDKMSGPFAQAGRAGERDGRIDRLLDAGEYKIRLSGHPEAEGEVALAVRSFNNRSTGILKPLQLVEKSLGDLEQHSFVFEIKKRRMFHLELMGRNLKDARLWLPGKWLTEISPTVTVFEAETGKPMTHIEFHHELEPGSYTLACYGGEAMKWAAGPDDHPLYVRMGVENIGESGERAITVSPFGRETFALSRNTNFMEVRRDDKKKTSLSMRYIRKNRSVHGRDRFASITKKSRHPWCVIEGGRGSEKWVTVQARPGDRLTLNYFAASRSSYISLDRGKYWISSHHAAEGADSVDVTAILTRSHEKMPLKYQTVDLTTTRPLSRKINVMGETTLYVMVKETGAYAIEESGDAGTEVRYRIEPFMTRYPSGFRRSPFERAGKIHDLAKGFHVLTIRPDQKGILSFTLKHADAKGPGNLKKGRDVMQGVVWPEVYIKNYNRLYFNNRYGIKSGWTVRSLPLDLDMPLSFHLAPGQEVPVRFKVRESAIFSVEADTPFEVVKYRKPVKNHSRFKPGSYTVKIKNTGRRSAVFFVKTTPDTEAVAGKREDMSGGFPILKASRPVYDDYERNEKKYYRLQVKKAGLYRLETSGRLATKLSVRSRLDTSLFTGDRNGIGRNALVQQYFRAGEYLVSVRTMDRSAGRLGVHLKRTELITGEGFSESLPKEASLPADAAIGYPFRIDKAGEYRLDTMGFGKTFRSRLEDADGWPLLRPGRTGEIQLSFAEGGYTYYSLPLPLESRRVTTLTRIVKPEPPVGKGPHGLSLNKAFSHTWRKGEPDQYGFTVETPVRVSCRISRGMEGVLLKGGEKLCTFRAQDGKGELLRLEAGDYSVRVTRLEEDDLFPYSLEIRTDDLTPGVGQEYPHFPYKRSFELSESALVDLESSGPTDVKARLTDASGRVVAANDDRPHNWNMRLVKHLPAGRYDLELSLVGPAYGPARVDMALRRPKTLEKRVLPFSLKADPGGGVMDLPFRADRDGLFRFSETAGGHVAMAVQKDGATIAEGQGSLLVPLEKGEDCRLLLWRLDRDRGALQVRAGRVKMKTVEPGDAGTVLKANTGYYVKDRKARTFAVGGEDGNGDGSVLFSPETGIQCTEIVNGMINLGEGAGWVFVEGSSVTLDPVVLTPDVPQEVVLDRRSLSLDIEGGRTRPMLLEVETSGAEMGAVILPASALFRGPEWEKMHMAEGHTVAVVPAGGDVKAAVWQTGRELKPMRATLSVHAMPFVWETGQKLVYGSEMYLAPGHAGELILEKGSHSLDLILSQGLVASVMRNGDVLQTVVASGGNALHRLPVKGGKLVVFNTGDREGLFKATREKRDPLDQVMGFDPGNGFEKLFRAEGTVTFRIPPVTASRFVNVSGDRVAATFFGADGVITRSAALSGERASGALLRLDYEAGYVNVHLDGGEDSLAKLFGQEPREVPQLIADEPFSVGDYPQKWSVSLEKDALLCASVSAPGMTALADGTGVRAVAASGKSTGRTLMHYLAPGDYTLWTRPLKREKQEGELVVRRIAPLHLGEGTGKMKFIKTGEIQVFRFHVASPARVGIGLKTEADRLTARLYDSGFQPVAEGPFMLEKLEKGDYLLIVEAEDEPTTYRPVLLGTTGDVTGIPDDVMGTYMN